MRSSNSVWSVCPCSLFKEQVHNGNEEEEGYDNDEDPFQKKIMMVVSYIQNVKLARFGYWIGNNWTT